MRSGTMALACCLTVSWAPPSIAIPGAESTHQRPGLTGQTSTGAIGQILAEVSHLRAEVAALRATRPLPPSDPLRASEPSGRAFASGDRPASSLVVTAFGALGDGTDDTAAFQRALDAAGSGGNAVVLVPAGTYVVPPALSACCRPHARCLPCVHIVWAVVLCHLSFQLHKGETHDAPCETAFQ